MTTVDVRHAWLSLLDAHVCHRHEPADGPYWCPEYDRMPREDIATIEAIGLTGCWGAAELAVEECSRMGIPARRAHGRERRGGPDWPGAYPVAGSPPG